jgi:hypothetical protein
MNAAWELRLTWSAARGWQLAAPLPETMDEILVALRPTSTPLMAALKRKGHKP